MNKKTIWIIVIFISVILVPSLLYLSRNKLIIPGTGSSVTSNPESSPADLSLMKSYSGTLSCSDCSGIETVLALTQTDANLSEGNFDKSEMYQGKATDALLAKGDWTTQKGNNSNPESTIIVLNPKDPEKIEYYLQVDGDHLEKLDKTGKQISEGNYQLTLQK